MTALRRIGWTALILEILVSASMHVILPQGLDWLGLVEVDSLRAACVLFVACVLLFHLRGSAVKTVLVWSVATAAVGSALVYRELVASRAARETAAIGARLASYRSELSNASLPASGSLDSLEIALTRVKANLRENHLRQAVGALDAAERSFLRLEQEKDRMQSRETARKEAVQALRRAREKRADALSFSSSGIGKASDFLDGDRLIAVAENAFRHGDYKTAKEQADLSFGAFRRAYEQTSAITEQQEAERREEEDRLRQAEEAALRQQREAEEERRNAERQIGWAYIRSEPNGADVYVDGERVGTTPVRVERLGRGSHDLRIEMKKFEDCQRTFEVDAQAETPIFIQLDRKSPRSKQVLSTNCDMSPRMPGNKSCAERFSTFLNGDDEEPSEHEVTASLSWDQEFRIPTGVDVAVDGRRTVNVVEPQQGQVFRRRDEQYGFELLVRIERASYVQGPYNLPPLYGRLILTGVSLTITVKADYVPD